jgi:hypothetical protein
MKVASNEGRAVAERHGVVLTASDGGGRFENVLVIHRLTVGRQAGGRHSRGERLLDVRITRTVPTLSAARFLCFVRAGLLPPSVTRPCAANEANTVAWLRPLNSRRSSAD